MRYRTSQSHSPGRQASREHPGLNAGTGSRRQRTAGLRRVGVLAAAAAGFALLALAAACGGGSSGGTGTVIHQTVYQRELAYAECMRAHGLPGFPDPQSDGAFNSTQANGGDFHGPQFQSANKSCAHLEGPGMTSAQFQQNVRQALRFAACMRAHGIANFQASAGQGGQIAIGAQGADPNSPQFQSAQRACRKLQPSGGGS
jgi:hypothetical protein